MAAPAVDIKGDPGEEGEDRDELAGGEDPFDHEAPNGVASIDFNNRPPNGIDHKIDRGNLTRELASKIEEMQDQKDNEGVHGVVELRGVKRHPNRRNGSRISEDNGERMVLGALTPVATTSREATQASKKMGNRQGRSCHIGDVQLIEFMFARKKKKNGKTR